MTARARIALVGDFSPEVVAHRAIPCALELARDVLGTEIAWQWLPTRLIDARAPGRVLDGFSGVWLVPASPYENTAGALAAVRFARETARSFLGTCGGFQHALLEIARDLAGLQDAEHAEIHPAAPTLVISPLACALVEKAAPIHFAAGSRLREIHGRDSTEEAYHCRYGFNPAHRAALERVGVRFTACDAAGEIRGAELAPAQHPFFVGTLFQPERAALRGEVPPLVRAFVRAAAEFVPR
jgi:CTP synthase (UTP-ammonia lyase)